MFRTPPPYKHEYKVILIILKPKGGTIDYTTIKNQKLNKIYNTRASRSQKEDTPRPSASELYSFWGIFQKFFKMNIFGGLKYFLKMLNEQIFDLIFSIFFYMNKFGDLNILTFFYMNIFGGDI